MSRDPSATFREVVETLATLDRRAGSEDETLAARWIENRLSRAGALRARVDHVPFYDGYAAMLLPLAGAGIVAGLATSTPRRSRVVRLAAAALGATAAVAIADDVSNGKRWWRKSVQKPKTTTNVVAYSGSLESRRTLVVLAHHDAAPTGAIFDQRLHHAVARRFPEIVNRVSTSLPMWWPIAGAPGLAALGAAIGSTRMSRLSVGLGVASFAAGLDIARNRIVPGANDNLSAVAVLVELAERFSAEPPLGLRVVLASVGAEEVLQGGIYEFVQNELTSCPKDQTWVLNLDTIGSPELLLVEGEGQFWMQEYCDPQFRDLVFRVADEIGRPLTRGARSRGSTDAVVTSRAGYPTALISSWDEHRALSNYHLMSDTPSNLHYSSLIAAADICESLARNIARQGFDDRTETIR